MGNYDGTSLFHCDVQRHRTGENRQPPISEKFEPMAQTILKSLLPKGNALRQVSAFFVSREILYSRWLFQYGSIHGKLVKEWIWVCRSVLSICSSCNFHFNTDPPIDYWYPMRHCDTRAVQTARLWPQWSPMAPRYLGIHIYIYVPINILVILF